MGRASAPIVARRYRLRRNEQTLLMTSATRTQVCIIGGGPSGLLLSQLCICGASTTSCSSGVLGITCSGVFGRACWSTVLPSSCARRRWATEWIAKGSSTKVLHRARRRSQRESTCTHSPASRSWCTARPELTLETSTRARSPRRQGRSRSRGRAAACDRYVASVRHLSGRFRSSSHRLRVRRRLRRLPRRQPSVHSQGQETNLREDLPVWLARRADADTTGLLRADLRQSRTRLRVVLTPFLDLEPVLHPGAAVGYGGRVVRRRSFSKSCGVACHPRLGSPW